MENSRSKDPFGIVDGWATSNRSIPSGPEEQELAGNLTTLIERANQARLPRERSWEFNRLQLKGEQYIVKNEVGDVLRVSFDDESETLPSVDNIIHPTARAFVGKLIRIIPSCVVLPRSEDRSDIRAAEVMDSFLDFQWRNLKMKKKYKRGMEFLSWAGTGIYQLCWDQEIGRKIGYCPQCHYASDTELPGTPCPVCSLQQQQMAMQGIEGPPPHPLVKIREGDMTLQLMDPRNFFPEPGVSELEDMEWCYTRVALPVQKIKRRFVDRADLVKEQEGIYIDRSLTYSVGLMGSNIETNYLRDHAYLYEFHEGPTGLHPEGRIIYMCNDRILEVREKNVYHDLFDRFPFFVVRADRMPGEFWGMPPIDQVWHMQRERNALCTQTREHRELTNNPKVLVAQNSGVDVDRFTTTPGEVIKYKATPGGRPAYLIPPPLAQYVYEEFDRLKRAIREKFCVTEHDMGESSPDQSGRFAAILEAQSSETISPIIVENLDEWLDLHRCILLLGQKYYSADRRWAVNGTDRPRTYEWGEVDIRGGWDLLLADEDSLSKNPAIRLQQATLLWDKGIFMDQATQQNDVKRFKAMAQLRLPGVGPDTEAAYRSYASSVPDMIARGMMVTPKPWDDALIMCQELIDWLRGPGMHAPQPIVMQVYQLWMVYAQALQPNDPRSAMVAPNAMLMQQPAQPAMGGQPQLPQASGSVVPENSLAGDVSQGIQQADQQAEQMARPAMPREGATVQ